MITWAALIVLQGIEGGVGEENGKVFYFLDHRETDVLQIYPWFKTC